MKLLLTNDDGVDAPGLSALEQAVKALGDVVIVAPDRPLSGCSHRTTTNEPLELAEVAASRHAVIGTPADCTRLGLALIAPDADWVLAGVNDGGNLGVDVFMSGTVAAVREAALLGKRAIAFSQYRAGRQPPSWPHVARMVEHVLDKLLPLWLRAGSFWNVNFPALDAQSEIPEIVFCPLDLYPLPMDFEHRDGKYHYRGVYQQRRRKPNGDVDVCFGGRISVTEVSLNGAA